jgi:hypothetical protein
MTPKRVKLLADSHHLIKESLLNTKQKTALTLSVFFIIETRRRMMPRFKSTSPLTSISFEPIVMGINDGFF